MRPTPGSATIARADYYQYDNRYATVCGKRPASPSGGRPRYGRAAQIAIELLDDLGQTARAVVIMVLRPGGRRQDQALGAEHRFRMAADQVGHDLDQTGLLPARTRSFQNSLLRREHHPGFRTAERIVQRAGVSDPHPI